MENNHLVQRRCRADKGPRHAVFEQWQWIRLMMAFMQMAKNHCTASWIWLVVAEIATASIKGYGQNGRSPGVFIFFNSRNNVWIRIAPSLDENRLQMFFGHLSDCRLCFFFYDGNGNCRHMEWIYFAAPRCFVLYLYFDFLLWLYQPGKID